MSKNTRGVKAYISDSNTTNCAKGIPKKHWVVYYYLLSISKWNYKDKEQHRYVYKKDVNISEISKRLKVSRTTYYSAIENLINNLKWVAITSIGVMITVFIFVIEQHLK